MSYRLEYQYVGLRIAGSDLNDGIDRYAICVEGGDNNAYTGSGRNARRARSWQVQFLGTQEQILERACSYAAGCEDGQIKPLGKYSSCEAYLARIRTLMENAGLVDDAYSRGIYLSLEYTCDIGSYDDQMLSATPIIRSEEKAWYSNKTMAKFSFKNDGCNDFRTFFDVFNKLYRDRSGWHFATCSGPM